LLLNRKIVSKFTPFSKKVPLFLKKNATDLCFRSNAFAYPYTETPASPITLKYDICQIDPSTDKSAYLNKLHSHVISSYFAKPTALPDASMFKYPIWSTWAKYKKNISEAVVLAFADEIKQFAQNRVAHLEIDDFWETSYGSLEFDKSKFPDFAQLTKKLTDDYGFSATLWMHPFTNIETLQTLLMLCDNYLEVRTIDGLRPAITSWWDGPGAVILDVTNSNATEYFYNKLSAIQRDQGLSSFKFDAGEINWLPRTFWLSNQTLTTPLQYTEAYARLAARFGDKIEIRVGAKTQDLPVFVRMLDKDSNWTIGTNGLESLVTTALTMSILGYPFILPDMIGRF
jgi:alpha-glucosidase (family GH31 glycosyl hydrolase)